MIEKLFFDMQLIGDVITSSVNLTNLLLNRPCKLRIYRDGVLVFSKITDYKIVSIINQPYFNN